jgi:lipoate-protein ligase A
MYHLQLTLETPAENLALDEALLDAAIAHELPGEVLRLWEADRPFVVLGRSSPLEEVHVNACQTDCVPVLRRASGGATVATGPGCLMYAVVLDRRRYELNGVDQAHAFVLDRMAQALAPVVPGIARFGTSDLALSASPVESHRARKFSGNSLRLKRDHLLYHGTILYDFPLERLSRWLAAPARTPEYRADREHEAFVMNFPAARDAIVAALLSSWQADEPLHDWPRERTAALAEGRYATIEW